MSSRPATGSAAAPDATAAAARADDPLAAPKASFADLDVVRRGLDLVSNPQELEGFLAERLQLRDHRVNIRSSVLIDFYHYVLDFSHKHSHTPEKASALLLIHERLLERLIALKPSDGFDGLLATLKAKLLELCAERTVRVAKKPPRPTPEELAEQEKKAKAAAAKKGAAAAKKEEEAHEPKPVEYETVVLPPLYSIDDARRITRFVLHTVVRHWLLYNYVFNRERARYVHKFSVHLEETVKPLDLCSALEEAKYRRQIEDAKKSAEEEERKRLEEEAARRKAAEEEVARRARRAAEEAARPKLSRDDLHEIAEYLKHHVA